MTAFARAPFVVAALAALLMPTGAFAQDFERRMPKPPPPPETPQIAVPPEMPTGKAVGRRGRTPKVESQQASQDQAAADDGDGQTSEPTQLPTYISRRDKRLGRKNADPRDAGTHHQSAERPDQRGSSGPRSMNWGDDI